MVEHPAAGSSSKDPPPPNPPIDNSEPQPKTNILPLLVLQQRALFKTLSHGFEKLQGLVNDRHCPEKQGLEGISTALGELSDSVCVIRRRMDAFIGMASDAGCIDLAVPNEPGEGEISPLIRPSARVREVEVNGWKNFSRPFPRLMGTDLQDQDCDYKQDYVATTVSPRGGTIPRTEGSIHCPALSSSGNYIEPPRTPHEGGLREPGDPEHDQYFAVPTRQISSSPNTPSVNPPSEQDDGRPATALPRVSVLINFPLEGSNIRKQVKRASKVRDPYFNEVRRISVLRTGVIRTTFYQAETTGEESSTVGEDESSLPTKDIDTQPVDRIGVVGRIVRHGRGFLRPRNPGRLRKE